MRLFPQAARPPALHGKASAVVPATSAKAKKRRVGGCIVAIGCGVIKIAVQKKVGRDGE